jgi:hypothetical protein
MPKVYKKCKHGKHKYTCVQCGGKGVCEHGKQRYYCIQCHGKGMCKHNLRRVRCKECRGSQICDHGRRKMYCKYCKGSQICEHNKRRSRCVRCNGVDMCKHKRQRAQCKECKGDRQLSKTFNLQRYIEYVKNTIEVSADEFYDCTNQNHLLCNTLLEESFNSNSSLKERFNCVKTALSMIGNLTSVFNITTDQGIQIAGYMIVFNSIYESNDINTIDTIFNIMPSTHKFSYTRFISMLYNSAQLFRDDKIKSLTMRL